jgi:tetratricopeptide (TPR) repeat protein
MTRIPFSFSHLLPIQQERELATWLSTCEQLRSSHAPDPQLLVHARTYLFTRLQDDPLRREAVHLGVKLCSLLKETALPRTFLTRYLTQSLSLEEEAWARWQLIDHLALEQRAQEVYQQQTALFAWAAAHFGAEEQLWTISDSTQARCWLLLGRGNEWMQWCSRLLAQTPRTLATRHARYCTLRTATDMALALGEIDTAHMFIAQIRELVQEDPTWEECFAVQHEASLLEIKLQAKQQNMSEIRRMAQQLAQFQHTPHRQEENEWSYPHNLGAVMYFLQQYDLAIPALRRAATLGSWSEHTYLWLAASLWADEATYEQHRAEVLSLLTLATALATGGSAWDAWCPLPEFEAWRTDPAFLQATQGQRAQTMHISSPRL